MEVKNKYQYIQAGVDISNTVRTTLGPKGMNKMLIVNNSPILTNDGATIIKNIAFKNPIADLFKKLAEDQENYVGDGTTTSVILAGQLLEKALELLNKNVHPTIIINGYHLARLECLKVLEKAKFEADIDPIIKTAFGSKISSSSVNHLTKLFRDIDLKKLRVYKVPNSETDKTTLIKGFAFEGYTINDRMPKEVTGKIAVIDTNTAYDSVKLNLASADELEKYNNLIKKQRKVIVDQLSALDVKCVFLTDTNPMLESMLTEKNIMTVVVYKRNLIDNICKASGARAVPDTNSSYSDYLGGGDVKYTQERQMIEILNENSEVQTLILHGSTIQTLDETERAVDDVIRLLRLDKNVVVGAGAIEIELSKALTEFSKQVGGKEQIAILKFAEALESIPLILAENCGLDAMEVLTLLKTQHEKDKTLGVDAQMVISSALKRNILEPVNLKKHAISSATEVANLILKLDDIYQGGGNE